MPARDTSVALGRSGALTSWHAGEETVLHLGTDPAGPNQRGYGNRTDQKLAVSGGSALVAWCVGVQRANGVFVQAVDEASAAPAGPARIVPGSVSRSGGAVEALSPASTRVPLVARQDRGFFVATVDGRRTTVTGWQVGAPHAITLAAGSSFKREVASAAPPGKKASVWVGWLQDGQFKLRRCNARATVFGATVTLSPPAGSTLSRSRA